MSVMKNSIVKANRFSTNGILEDMEIKYFEEAVWAKVFEHNSDSGNEKFSTIDECLNIQTTNKYSRLYLLDSLANTDGKYEFLLEYPDDYPENYNRWIQNNNPCNEFVTTTSAGDGTAEGYTAVHIDWNGHYWGGLTKQNNSNWNISPTYLSGSVGHSNWWFALGCSSSFSQSGVSGMPGPTNIAIGRVQLWVRIDNLPNESVFKITKNNIIATDFYEI